MEVGQVLLDIRFRFKSRSGNYARTIVMLIQVPKLGEGNPQRTQRGPLAVMMQDPCSWHVYIDHDKTKETSPRWTILS
jgi:hypothetical protein